MIRLGHVNIRTDRLQETADFYADILGMTAGPAATRPGSDNHIWMFDSTGTPSVHLQHSDAGETPENATLNHFAFNCDDLPSWRSRLASAGVEFTQSDFDYAGLVQLNIHDPNGVRVELTFVQPK